MGNIHKQVFTVVKPAATAVVDSLSNGIEGYLEAVHIDFGTAQDTCDFILRTEKDGSILSFTGNTDSMYYPRVEFVHGTDADSVTSIDGQTRYVMLGTDSVAVSMDNGNTYTGTVTLLYSDK